MKNKVLLLCAVTVVVTSTTGCGCARRFRDWICRGSRCSSPAPVAVAPAPIAVAPMACDPACSYAGYDPGCGYPGMQTYGYPPAYDSGWVPGAPGCESCSGGYALPQSYPSDGGYLTEPAPALPTDPGPAIGR